MASGRDDAVPDGARRRLIPAAWTVGREPLEIGLAVAVAAVALATLAGFLGRLAWWLDLMASFHLHLAAAALLVAVITIVLRRFRWAALCALLVGANLPPAWPYLGSPAIAAPPDVWRVASVNMKFDNPEPGAVLAQLHDDPADLVVLIEFQPRWRPLLAGLADVYPYRYVGRTAAWKGVSRGLVLLSRWPFRRVDTVSTDAAGRVLALRAVIGRLTLFGVHVLHALPPSSPTMSSAERSTLAKAVRAEKGPVAMVGDLNMTPYAAAYTKLTADAGLHRASASLAGTYPQYLGPFGLPIDHLLLGRGVEGSFHAVSAPGSDHRMLRGWIALTDKPVLESSEGRPQD